MSRDNETNLAKAALRRQLRALDETFTPADRAAASEKICARLREQAAWQRAQSVLFFWPMPEEPDLRPLITEACAAGKLVALPRFDTATRSYAACRIRNPQTEVSPGYYGIMEPVAVCPSVELTGFDLYLVPGVGFSLSGARLGRGKGYYDQILAGARGVKCGVAFDWQITPEIPLEAHDATLDCIVTPIRWHISKG